MLLQLFSWRAILDIAMIAAILFFLYNTLSRLGTWKIVAGIMIAAVVFFISSYIDLKGIEWIYRNVSHVAVISIVVLFQPELRKMFEKAATMQRQKSAPYDETLSRIISKSLWSMALKKIGAIIVIPGSESTKEWLNGGFPINAIPSSPLIMSIFDPHSPGHDGALIVNQGQFSRFGVRLPISQSGRLSEEYGTRHQAAMGLSEHCDALVLVVSEERGQVSAFHKGDKQTFESEEHIFRTICFQCKKEGGSQLDKPYKNNAGKISLQFVGSLVVATIFWLGLIAGQMEMLEKIITVPVEYTATSDEVVMIGEKPKDVRLHLTGAKSDLDAASPSSLSVKIDLSQSGVGKQVFPISEDNIQIPKGIRLIDVEPPNVEITIAKLIRKHIMIEPQLVGKFPDGIVVESIKTIPDSVGVFLPSEEKGQMIESIKTTPIFLSNIRENTTLYCKIIAPPTIQPVDKRWPDVSVLISLKVQKK